MDANTLTTLISTVGFPIVCCAALFWQQNKVMKDFSEKVESALNRLSENTQLNTDSIIKLVATVDMLSNHKGDD